MNRKIITPFTSLLLVLFSPLLQAQQTPFELDPDSNTTFTYDELVDYFTRLVAGRDDVRLFSYGKTDVGKPLHLIIVSKDGVFEPEKIKEQGKAILFINNGIHPGEPEGIDASMMFLRDLLKTGNLPDDLVLCLVPVYNVAGMLNRGTSRVNQNGPDTYGFRGSRQHYDLNRDFVKGDSRNSRLFQQIFTTWDPDVFLDTHASNGADYQYVMTLIETHRDKLHPKLAELMKEEFTEPLYQRMESDGFPMIPYVNTKEATPESGIVSFLESPRYSTGYAALHHTIGYMPETHMWKSYGQRVRSTYAMIRHLFELTSEGAQELISTRNEVKAEARIQAHFPVSWQLDTTNVDTIDFKGYQFEWKTSEVSGDARLFYNRNKPYEKRIPYYTRYRPETAVRRPKAYIVPQAYDHIVQLMRLNGVRMRPVARDTVIDVEMYRIASYNTGSEPYEGHYLHYDVMLDVEKRAFPYYAGDWIIPTDQPAVRYIVEMLEPQGTDSFFSWNFFDGILSQKEYFSPYIFEEEASRILKKDPALKRQLEEAKTQDPDLASSSWAQLDWIYRKTEYYEDTHLLYPVGKQY